MKKWKSELQHSSCSLQDLLEIISLSKSEQKQISQILERSPMQVTPYYLSLIDFKNEADPIRKMAIPALEEADTAGSLDTSGELDNTVIVGLQHKYAETALLLSTNACAMYCRHCFRKRLVGLEDDTSARDLGAVCNYIIDHPEINNVLISGGDALLDPNERIDDLLSMLVDIPHLDFIRIASRTPVTLPYRVSEDAELIKILAKHNEKKKLYVVTQFNHPNEITKQSRAAVKAFLSIGIPVRNQSVLLNGVNDEGKTLGTLIRELLGMGVEPYYVFQCRSVSGVKNRFQVPLQRGYEIVEEAKAMQSGLGKAFRYCMSTVVGKLEVVASLGDGQMLFKCHEAKNSKKLGRVFVQDISPDQGWIEFKQLA